MAIEIVQAEKEIRKRWWKWSVWLKGPAAELDSVKRVVYHLHPTFPNPEREVTERSNGFRLDSSGWGTFELGVDIHYTSGKVESRSHNLTFSWNLPSEAEDEQQTVPTKEPPPEEASAAPRRDAPKTVLMLHDLKGTKLAGELRQSLELLGVSVADASSVTGSSWSKELVDSIHSYDCVISVGETESGSKPVEAKIAQKLGKRIIELDPLRRAAFRDGQKLTANFNVGALSRAITEL